MGELEAAHADGMHNRGEEKHSGIGKGRIHHEETSQRGEMKLPS
jgi:hypothetical protein